MTPNFFQAATLKKNLGRFYRVDFTGYPSNQFSGYREYFNRFGCHRSELRTEYVSDSQINGKELKS